MQSGGAPTAVGTARRRISASDILSYLRTLPRSDFASSYLISSLSFSSAAATTGHLLYHYVANLSEISIRRPPALQHGEEMPPREADGCFVALLGATGHWHTSTRGRFFVHFW